MPYFHIPTVHLGPIPIHPFGVLVAIGCLLGANLVEKRALKTGLDMDATRSLITWILVCGFVGAHVFDVLAYTPQKLVERPWLILEIWNGISSFGGFMGALVGFFVFLRRRGLPYLPYADALAMGLAPGWVFGRAGCSIAHDHIGRLTTFFLAVRYPADHEPSGVRHNLGFYELLYAILIAALLYHLAKKPRPAGVLVGVMAVAYAPVRFFLDFLRATDITAADPRYAGLTPGQWLAIATLLVGIAVIRRAREQNVVLAFRAPAPAASAGSG
ncbi:MAG: prolipoprotein diacylglyceryl transferase [Deltaproteobacteria bacterium]|nr:prolipoprotein diacylglyceryl transferase [Deltaproteobacteria bacterium]